MFYAICDGVKFPAGTRPNWVKLQSNGVFVHCGENEGDGVIIEGEIYHVNGRKDIDKPTVELVWEEETLKLIEQLTNAQLALVEQYERNCTLENELTHTQLALVEIYETVVNSF